MSMLAVILFGALSATAVPVILALFVIVGVLFAKTNERGEVAWALIPVAILIVICAIIGGVAALIFGVWWAGLIVTTVAPAAMYLRAHVPSWYTRVMPRRMDD